MVKVTKHGGSLSHHRKRGFVLHNTVVKKHTHTFFLANMFTSFARKKAGKPVFRGCIYNRRKGWGEYAL